MKNEQTQIQTQPPQHQKSTTMKPPSQTQKSQSQQNPRQKPHHNHKANIINLIRKPNKTKTNPTTTTIPP